MGSYAAALQHKQDVSDEERRLKAEPLISQTKSLQSDLSSFKDANGNVMPEYQGQYDKALSSLTNTQQAFDELYHPIKAPGAIAQDFHWLASKVHNIPEDVAKKVTPSLPGTGRISVSQTPTPSWGQAQVLKHKAASLQKAQEQANLLASGSSISPTQQAMATLHTDEVVRQAQVDSTLRMAKNLGLSDTAIDELKQQMVGLKNITPKPLPGAAGQPYPGPDGIYRQAVSNPDGTIGYRQMPSDWKPNTKAIRGTLVNTKDHGWIQTWVNPYTLQIMGYQKVTPGSRYAGTASSSSSTDALGIKTSSSRATTPAGGSSSPVDIDLSGVQQLPENYTGEEPIPSPVPAPSGSVPVAGAAPQVGSSSATSLPTATAPTPIARHTVTPKTHPITSATPSQLKSQVPAPPVSEHNGNAYFNSLVGNILSGKMAPSEITGRGADKLAIMARASEVDPNFDPSKADSDYKYANEKSTRDLLNYLTSLTGRKNDGGNLGDLVRASDLIDRTDFPPLNDKIGWAKLNSGNRQMAEYYTTITEVADQVAKILQGGGSGGGTSDAKLRQASELFDKGFTKDQIKGVADSLRSLLGNRKDAIIGDNYYLNRWYKPKAEHFVYAKDPKGNIKRKQAEDQSPLPQGWIMMPQGWTPNAAGTTK